MPSYVFVWENNTFGHQKVSGHTWPGHSAMNIGKEFWFSDDGATQQNYVSWWPSEGASFGVLGALFGKNQKGGFTLCLMDDVENEGYLPDHVIELQTTAKQEGQMMAEWKSVLNKKGGSSYKTLRKNCSTICSRVLHAGGFHAKKWAVDNNFVWSPADIRALAVASGGTMLPWTAFLRVLGPCFIKAEHFKDDDGKLINYARSGRYCSTGVTCKYQSDETWQPSKKG